MSFMRFLGINLCDKVPDAKTIWKFKNDLAETKTVNTLFCMFDEYLEKEGLISHKGTIVDATFVDEPRQRNSRDENKKIKNGEIPEEWEKPENKIKLAQKDTDADWTKKNGERHFGYKDHVKITRSFLKKLVQCIGILRNGGVLILTVHLFFIEIDMK